MSYWAGDNVGATVDWFEFVAAPADGDDHPTRYLVNVSFLLSSWRCIFGDGCPGILISGAMPDCGCCQIGVHIGEDEFDRVQSYVNRLTPALADNYDQIHSESGWFYPEYDQDEREDGYLWHTVVKDGACIFANRTNGSAGKIGCALHLLADSLQIHPSETKPDICWQVPIAVTKEFDDRTGVTTVTIDATTGGNWGNVKITGLKYPGWWCTETPDAYIANELVYRSHEHELRKLIGDTAYDELCTYLDSILAQGGRRVRMPGEQVHAGQPLIPLMVERRADAWQRKGKQKKLRRSKRYLETNAATIQELMAKPTMDIAPGR